LVDLDVGPFEVTLPFLRWIVRERTPQMTNFNIDALEFTRPIITTNSNENPVLKIDITVSKVSVLEVILQAQSHFQPEFGVDLTIKRLYGLSDAGVLLLTHHNSNLTALHFSGHTRGAGHASDCLHLFAMRAPVLRELTITHSDVLDGTLMVFIDRSPLLEVLRVSACANVTSRFIEHITHERLPSLLTAEVSQNVLVAHAVLSDLQLRMPQVSVIGAVLSSNIESNNVGRRRMSGSGNSKKCVIC
jgi:hypothetical protein